MVKFVPVEERQKILEQRILEVLNKKPESALSLNRMNGLRHSYKVALALRSLEKQGLIEFNNETWKWRMVPKA